MGLLAAFSFASFGFGALLVALGGIFAANAGGVATRVADFNRRTTTKANGEASLGRTYGMLGVLAVTTFGMRVRGALSVAVGVVIAVSQPF